MLSQLKHGAGGVGGLVAMFTVEQFNVWCAALIGVLTVAHLAIKLRKELKK